MINNMLEHQKRVLEKISDNEELFNKELSKSRRWLSEKDFNKLQEWIKVKHSGNLTDAI